MAPNKITAAEATIPVLTGLTTNTFTKIVIAAVTGGRRFSLQVIAGLLLVIAAAWAGLAIAGGL